MIGVMARQTREQVLAEICSSALRLFVEQGYEATTLAQIGASVGYSKSAMLYHFASKEALLEQALQEPMRRLAHYQDEVADRTPHERLSGLVDLVLAHRHEATLLLKQGQLVDQLGAAVTATDGLVTMFLGPAPDLAHAVAVHVALAGLAETATSFPDTPASELRAPLLAAAARALDLPA